MGEEFQHKGLLMLRVVHVRANAHPSATGRQPLELHGSSDRNLRQVSGGRSGAAGALPLRNRTSIYANVISQRGLRQAGLATSLPDPESQVPHVVEPSRKA